MKRSKRKVALTAANYPKAVELVKAIARKGEARSWEFIRRWPNFASAAQEAVNDLKEAGFIQTEVRMEHNPYFDRLTRVTIYRPGPEFGKLLALIEAADAIGPLEEVGPTDAPGAVEPEAEGQPV